MTTPTPTQAEPTLNEKMIKNGLPLVEKILLIALAIGIILALLNIDHDVVKLTLLALAAVFFLLTYRPIDLPAKEGEQLGFAELIALNIIPKTLWISSAISAIGIAFYLYNFNGARQILIIGAPVIAFDVVLLIIFAVMGTRYMHTAVPVLLRAVPLLIADVYILFQPHTQF
jgi:hypothetical protein